MFRDKQPNKWKQSDNRPFLYDPNTTCNPYQSTMNYHILPDGLHSSSERPTRRQSAICHPPWPLLNEANKKQAEGIQLHTLKPFVQKYLTRRMYLYDKQKE